MNELEIKFIEPETGTYVKTLTELAVKGVKNVLLRPFNELAKKFLEAASSDAEETSFLVVDEGAASSNEGVSLYGGGSLDGIFIFEEDPDGLSDLLMEYLDLDSGTIVAPVTANYFANRPLFLISIPKSGTHLLYKLVEEFGYYNGIVCPERPSPRTWYCVEYSNSHTVAKDFFVDTVRRSPFGNRDHPFMSSPAIMIYRNPMDIVVSEANYFHREGKAAFYSYLNSLDFEDRLLKLIDDPWMLGSIRDRIGNFIPWLALGNVIPVSFEELIGSSGGGSTDIQRRLIWSLQLKLHIPGNPASYGEKVFDADSPTFTKGQVGSSSTALRGKVLKKFKALEQDFMLEMGYDLSSSKKGGPPGRSEEFRKRPLVLSSQDFCETPIAVESGYRGYNIIKYKENFYAIASYMGEVDLTSTDEATMRSFCRSSSCFKASSSIEAKRLIDEYLMLASRPVCVKTDRRSGYRIYAYKDRFYAISPFLKAQDLVVMHKVRLEEYLKLGECIIGDSVEELTKALGVNKFLKVLHRHTLGRGK